MKKKLIPGILALSLIASLSVPGTAFAVDAGAATATTAAVSTQAAISAEPVSISYEDACKKILANSPEAIKNEILYKNDLATAKGSAERIHSINDTRKQIDAGLASQNSADQVAAQIADWQFDASSKDMLKAAREFATAQAPKNKQARENALNGDTLDLYFNLKLAEATEAIAKENLDLYNDILKNTQLKFKVGSASKMDVLVAQVQANSAKTEHTTALNNLNNGYMEFNLKTGSNILQKLTLTTQLTETVLPTTTLDETIKNALEKNNDILGAAYNLKMAKMALEDVRAYPQSSSKYMTAKASLDMAQMQYDNAPETIEISVRAAYAAMMEKYEAVTLGKTSVESADETTRLAKLQYTAGFISLTDMNEKALTAYRTKLGYQKTLLEYAQAVYAYNILNGVGDAATPINGLS